MATNLHDTKERMEWNLTKKKMILLSQKNKHRCTLEISNSNIQLYIIINYILYFSFFLSSSPPPPPLFSYHVFSSSKRLSNCCHISMFANLLHKMYVGCLFSDCFHERTKRKDKYVENSHYKQVSFKEISRGFQPWLQTMKLISNQKNNKRYRFTEKRKMKVIAHL